MNKPVSDEFVIEKYNELKPFEEWESDNIICYRRHDTLLVAERLEFKEWLFTLCVVFDNYVRRYTHKNRPRDAKSYDMLQRLGWEEYEHSAIKSTRT